VSWGHAGDDDEIYAGLTSGEDALSRDTATVERQVRAAWTGPGMTVGRLQKAAKISKNSASKWRKVLLAEASEPQGDMGETAV
jgi:hypothetical protein